MPGHRDSDSRALRALLTALLAAGGLAVHLVVQRLAPAPIAHPRAELAGWVPFLPWTIWVYLSFFPLLVAAGVLVPARRWWRLVLAWAMASVTSWILVLVVPVTFPRPDPTALGSLPGWSGTSPAPPPAPASVNAWAWTSPAAEPTPPASVHAWVFGAVHGVDAAHVTFPCLHAAVIWIAWLALRDQGAGLRAGGLVVAAAITLSTMTTRQHLVTDNLAGLAIAWASARVALPQGTASRVAADQAPGRKAASGSRS